MINNVEAFKKFAVTIVNALKSTSYTTADFEGETIAEVLKSIAVKLGCASTTDDIRAYSSAEVLDFIAENYDSEEKEPYDLVITDTNVNVTVKRKGKTISEGTDILYNGDELTIEAVGAEGYEITTLTVNGEDIESGDKITVSGKVTIVATGTLKTFDLERTATDCTIAVTKGGEAISDGEDVISYGDEITITATVEEGYVMSSLKVNGEDFVSGETLTVDGDVEIIGVAEATE